MTGCEETEVQNMAPPAEEPSPGPDLLALGDSYTVGHGIPTEWSWPYQLADSMTVRENPLREMRVVARTGWTTRDLLSALRDSIATGYVAPDGHEAVTLMIGVNNQFQHVPVPVFAAELDTLILEALALVGGDPERVLGFNIPNYGLTPTGELYGSAQITRELEEFNQVLFAVYDYRGIEVIDIATLAQQVTVEPGLVSRDGLHYSREMYRRWVAAMRPALERCLAGGEEGE